MRTAYSMTNHARARMLERRIDPVHAVQALQTPPYIKSDGTIHYYDKRTRVKVIVSTEDHSIITVYKAARLR